MTDTIHDTIGKLRDDIGGFRADIRNLARSIDLLRDDTKNAMAQHDARDDERFTSQGARLQAIEKQLAIDAAEERRRQAERQEHHAWLNFIAPTVGAVIGAAVAAGITFVSMGGIK